RFDLRQSARELCRDRGEPRPGGDRLVRGAGADDALPSHRPVRADAQMSTAAMSAVQPRTRAAGYWTALALIVAAPLVAPLARPPFWQRFVTEILIWGLLAMSSDILIGYTGMVSFGHSAFFGLGMYGAAAALLTVKPPSLWLAILYGLGGGGASAGFGAYFAPGL